MREIGAFLMPLSLSLWACQGTPRAPRSDDGRGEEALLQEREGSVRGRTESRPAPESKSVTGLPSRQVELVPGEDAAPIHVGDLVLVRLRASGSGLAPEYRFGWDKVPVVGGDALAFEAHEHHPPPRNVDGGGPVEHYLFRAKTPGRATLSISVAGAGSQASGADVAFGFEVLSVGSDVLPTCAPAALDCGCTWECVQVQGREAQWREIGGAGRSFALSDCTEGEICRPFLTTPDEACEESCPPVSAPFACAIRKDSCVEVELSARPN